MTSKISKKYDSEAKHRLRFEYLSVSQRYLDCCAAGGAGPLGELYEAFGDVRGLSYEQWREARQIVSSGLEAFHCKKAESAEEAAFWIGDGGDDGALVVICNTAATVAQLKSSFSELLKNHVKPKYGRHTEDFDLKFPFGAKVHTNALRKALSVYKMRQEKDADGKNKFSLYEIGLQLNISEKIFSTPEGLTGKKEKIVSTVRRLLIMAERTIENLNNGIFP